MLYLRSDLEGVEPLSARLAPLSHPRLAASIFLCLVYHPSRAATASHLISHILNNMEKLRSRFPSAKVVICGDFVQLNTSKTEKQLNLTQVVDFSTYAINTRPQIMGLT